MNYFRLLTILIITLSLLLLGLSAPIGAQTEIESEPEGEPDGYTLEDVQEEIKSSSNHSFWGVDFGLSIPIGLTESFNSPLFIDRFAAPRSYSDFYREGHTTNFYGGIITPLGFEASLSFRMTKVNYTNEAKSLMAIEADSLRLRNLSLGPIGEFSSYLLGTQAYIGQRMKPIEERGESLYFGLAAEITTLKHYSETLNTPEETSLALSFIAGDEIPLQKLNNSFQMLTLRIQGEIIVLAGDDRPRFINLTFGVRGYID